MLVMSVSQQKCRGRQPFAGARVSPQKPFLLLLHDTAGGEREKSLSGDTPEPRQGELCTPDFVNFFKSSG
jgi:hypothetical protein